MTEQSRKTILVTGASSGIGRAITTLLLEQGYRVTGLARDFSKFPCHDRHFTRGIHGFIRSRQPARPTGRDSSGNSPP